MPADVLWRPQALRDLEAIEAYYKEVAPDFASVFVAGAFEATRVLSLFARSGRMVPEVGGEAAHEVIYHRYQSF